MKPRFAIRSMLLLGGVGFGMLATVFLVTLSALSPLGQIRHGPLAPTPTDLPLPPPGSPPPRPPATSLPPTYSPWVATVAGGVPALPLPVPTDGPSWSPPPFCAGSNPYPAPCTPAPASPTPPQVLLSPTPYPSTMPWETGHGDFGVWNYDYGYYPSEGETWATVHYDSSSVDSIQAYATANRALAAEVAQMEGGARVDITFRTPMPLSQIHDWALGHGLYSGWLGVRVVDSAGGRDDYPLMMQYSYAPSLVSPLAYPGADEGSPVQYQVEGVFYISGMVEARRVPEFAADPLVFLADVTSNLVRKDLMSRRPIPPYPDLQWVTIEPSSPFRQMEDLGLDHFR